MIEKFNLVEQVEFQKLREGSIESHEYQPQLYQKDGLVLSICESNFPHQVSFMLIEPCSHIQWEHSYSDEKLNIIETRQQRLNFIGNLHQSFDQGILRGVGDQKRSKKVSVGEQEFLGSDILKDTFF